jgi:hypothetical protein
MTYYGVSVVSNVKRLFFRNRMTIYETSGATDKRTTGG